MRKWLTRWSPEWIWLELQAGKRESGQDAVTGGLAVGSLHGVRGLG